MDVSAISSSLQVAQTRFEKAATGIAAAATAPDTVSLSDQAVALLSAKNQFTTDVHVAHVMDNMQKSLLDMLG